MPSCSVSFSRVDLTNLFIWPVSLPLKVSKAAETKWGPDPSTLHIQT